MAMQLVGHGRYELTIRQDNEKVRSDYDLLGLPMFHIQGRTFIKLNLENNQNETFRLAGEFIPNTAVETFPQQNSVLHTEQQLREIIRQQAVELDRWRKYPTPGSSTSSMTMLDWLFYLRNEQIDEHTISALCDWLEEKGETKRLEEVKKYWDGKDNGLTHVLRQCLINGLLKV